MIRVLLVEDHRIVADGLKQLLEADGDIQVTAVAHSAKEGLVKGAGAAIEVALLDVSLPDHSGVWLLETLRSQKPDLPVLILSMHCDEATVMEALSAGASGYLTKNSLPAELRGAVRTVHQGGSYLQAEIAPHLLRAVRVGQRLEEAAEGFDQRELEVLRQLGIGQSNQQIAETLYLSLSTVKTTLRQLFRKLEATSRTEAAMEATRRGLIKNVR